MTVVDGEKFGGWVVNYPVAFDIRTVPYRPELSHDFESADRFEFSVGIAWFLGIVGTLAILNWSMRLSGYAFPKRKKCSAGSLATRRRRLLLGSVGLEAGRKKSPEHSDAATKFKNAEQGLDDIMTKIEAVIQNSKLEAVKTALQEIGVEGMTVLEVRGHGRQKGHTEVYRGREYSVDLIPKTKIEMVLAEAMVEKAVQAILGAARTGKIGDGKIFLSRVDEAIRIRNDERGEGAL